MKNNNFKKIPVIRYLCCLLFVCALFTGVTFSRYTDFTSGDINTPLTRFACSYEIEDMSAATFSNADYWLLSGTGSMNTARTVRFKMRNHTLSAEGGVNIISEVNLDGTLRFYAPAEFAGNLALQVAEETSEGFYVTKTPQYVLGNLIYQLNENEGVYEYAQENRPDRVFADHGAGISFDTSKQKDFDERTDGDGNYVNEILTLSGGFQGSDANHSGIITAQSADGNKIQISAATETASYSVGFSRYYQNNQSSSAPMLYLDCQKEIPFYTIDISLPEMSFDGGTAQEKTFVLFLTVVEKTTNDDFLSTWDNDFDLSDPAKGDLPKTFNGAMVTGYHFDAKASVYNLDGETPQLDGETTVRVQKTYDYANGGSKINFFHIAPLSENAASVSHSIDDFFNADKSDASLPSGFSIDEVQGVFGLCSNGGTSGYISFAGVTDDPYRKFYEGTSGNVTFEISKAMSKGYAVKINAVFIQSDESGEGV